MDVRGEKRVDCLYLQRFGLNSECKVAACSQSPTCAELLYRILTLIVAFGIAASPERTRDCTLSGKSLSFRVRRWPSGTGSTVGPHSNSWAFCLVCLSAVNYNYLSLLSICYVLHLIILLKINLMYVSDLLG